MSRVKWIEEMIRSGMSENDILESMLKGNAMQGAKPMTGDKALMFAKLNYKKILKKVKGN